MRIGHGFDAHRFEMGRRLILAGVEVPYSMGLQAHSDGDVIIHALCDALLGAAALSDIGHYFPDNQAIFRNIDSRILLRRVMDLLHARHYQVVNADITVLAEAPKLAPYRQAMCVNLAEDMKLTIEQINIKATTTEGMGYIGRKEGMAAFAVVLLNSA